MTSPDTGGSGRAPKAYDVRLSEEASLAVRRFEARERFFWDLCIDVIAENPFPMKVRAPIEALHRVQILSLNDNPWF